jgi:hypothetical protein
MSQISSDSEFIFIRLLTRDKREPLSAGEARELLAGQGDEIKRAAAELSDEDLLDTLCEIDAQLHFIFVKCGTDGQWEQELLNWLDDVLDFHLVVSKNFKIAFESQAVSRDSLALQDQVEIYVAKQVFDLVKNRSLACIKKCVECDLHFVAYHFDAQYCGRRCSRQRDLIRHRSKYGKQRQARVRKGIYLPEQFHYCEHCRKPIGLSESDKSNPPRDLNCPRCNKKSSNPHWEHRHHRRAKRCK